VKLEAESMNGSSATKGSPSELGTMLHRKKILRTLFLSKKGKNGIQ